jgi:hypothetical protein
MPSNEESSCNRRNSERIEIRFSEGAETITRGACAPRSVEIRVIRGLLSILIDDLEAHLTGGAGDDLESGFVVARV